MNWRPEGWKESAEATAKQCAADEEFRNAAFENVIRGMFEAGADAMLEKVCEEIKKGLLTDEGIESARFQACCSRGYGPRGDDTIDEVAEKTAQTQLQKILDLFRPVV